MLRNFVLQIATVIVTLRPISSRRQRANLDLDVVRPDKPLLM